jgi:hypothetical protein
MLNQLKPQHIGLNLALPGAQLGLAHPGAGLGSSRTWRSKEQLEKQGTAGAKEQLEKQGTAEAKAQLKPSKS